ncbi:MAG: N-acetylmuramoyl-L-alanine amidase [Kiritimatiellae bacterium]|nr:N-acetylmuramoyl-L-alanine amidase [Kiritimatiellia bacterium]
MKLAAGILLLGVMAAVAAEPEIRIVFPKEGGRFPAGQTVTYVMGSVKPADAALTFNGQPVDVFRKTGSFVLMAPLREGANTLAFQSGKTAVRRTVTVAAPSVPDAEEVVPFTTAPIGVLTNERVTISCKAPEGYTLQAKIGGIPFPLQYDPERKWYSAGFSSAKSMTVDVSFLLIKPEEKGGRPKRVLMEAEGGGDRHWQVIPETRTFPGPTITVKDRWPSYRVTGKLFEVRMRSQPNDGETLGFPRPGISLAATGYRDGWLRCVVDGREGWVPLSSVTENKKKVKPVTTLEDLSVGFPARPAPGKKPGDILVVLDPGHGGTDTGALGPGGTMEKEANWKQAKAIEKALKAAGFKVKLTRQGDQTVGLYERVRFAYENHADLFISVHHNSTAAQTDPREVRHFIGYGWNRRGVDLARALHPKMAAVAEIPDRGVKESSFAVCRNPAVPSCLFEFDFINCPEGEDAIFNSDRRERFGTALAEALTEWVKAPGQDGVQKPPARVSAGM